MVSAALPRKILQSNQHAKVNNRQSVFRHCTVFSHLLAPDIHNRNPAGPITCRLKQTAFSSREYRSCGTSSGRPRAGPKVNLLAVALRTMRMGISESRARFRRTVIRYSSRPGAGWVLATFSPTPSQPAACVSAVPACFRARLRSWAHSVPRLRCTGHSHGSGLVQWF